MIFSACSIDDEDTENIDTVLHNFVYLQTVDFSKNEITLEGTVKILSGLKNSNSHLREINFSMTNIHAVQENSLTIELENVLSEFCHIEKIDFLGTRMFFLCYNVTKGLLGSRLSLRLINFSFCDLIPDHVFGIEDVLLNFSKLEEIKFEENKELYYGCGRVFIGLKKSRFTLKKINFSNTDFSKFEDLPINFYALKEVSFHGCKKLKFNFDMILESLKNCMSTLEKVDFSYCELQADNFHEKNCILLANLYRLREISLSNNNDLGLKCFEILYYLSETFLQKINMSFCIENWAELERHEIKNYLRFQNLKEFEFTNNDFDICDIFEGIYSTNESLEKINLSGCLFNLAYEENICRSLSNFHKITTIEISNFYNLGEGFLAVLTGLINCNSSLERINFSHCYINDYDLFEISNVLFEFSNMKEIDFSKNFELNYGCVYILYGLINSSSTLQRVNFSNCNLSKDGAFFLKNILLNYAFIEELLLENNTNLEDGYKYVIQGLSKSQYTLKNLNLMNCGISDRKLISQM